MVSRVRKYTYHIQHEDGVDGVEHERDESPVRKHGLHLARHALRSRLSPHVRVADKDRREHGQVRDQEEDANTASEYD
jgi:hypothetical protein